MDSLLELGTRKCFGCTYLRTFTPRPDERERYGFGCVGYLCQEPGFEGYVSPDKPICVRGPFIRARSQQDGGGE